MTAANCWAEISLSDFRGLATLNISTYLPTYLGLMGVMLFVFSSFEALSNFRRSASGAQLISLSFFLCLALMCFLVRCSFPMVDVFVFAAPLFDVSN